MLSFKSFLKEEAEEGAKLKHIHHAEDRPMMHGHEGFEHAHGALTQAHEHMKAGHKSSGLTMKYDGSPSVVYGHHPETKKFFVASKSAFNKDPKINYTHKDIEKNHGHAPGLVDKLKSALTHLPKVAPKTGVYQGDIMHSGDVHHDKKAGTTSFTPNTITYTAHGDKAKEHKDAKLGVVTHTKYEGKDMASMKATPHVSDSEFTKHKDVAHHTAEHDTSKISYPQKAQDDFHKHMNAAKDIHDTHGAKMYPATEKHRGENSHMTTYINSTVKNDQVPSAKGFQEHIKSQGEKAAAKVKTEKSQTAKRAEAAGHIEHVEKNKEHYGNLFSMHHHLAQAKNTLVKHLETHEGGYEHHINGTKSKPEGFVVNHKDEPTKLVNRSEFAKANLLKVKK
jgi:hypothetical protein